MEMKNNDRSGRFKDGEVGVACELGRPCVGFYWRDLEKIAITLAEMDVDFEPQNPTSVLLDLETGRIKDDYSEIRDERTLSAIIECKTTFDKIVEIYKKLHEVTKEIDTVFSLSFINKCQDGIPPLKEELERLFKKKNLSEVTQDEMNQNIDALNKIHGKVKELNRANNQLRQKYHGDAKYTRIHKRLQEHDGISESERKVFEALTGVKQKADDQVMENAQLLDNESYFERMMMPHVIEHFMKQQKIKLTPDASRYINKLVVSEYLNEFNTGSRTW